MSQPTPTPLSDALATWGTLPLSTVLSPAIRLAEEGYPVAPITAHHWALQKELLQRNQHLESGSNDLLLPSSGGGHTPRAGEMFHNSSLAVTMREVAEGGKAAFYEGRVADAICSVVREAGGESTLHTATPLFASSPLRLSYVHNLLFMCISCISLTFVHNFTCVHLSHIYRSLTQMCTISYMCTSCTLASFIPPPGVMQSEDLSHHLEMGSTFGQPISVAFLGAEVHEPAPNACGIAALLALRLIEGLDPSPASLPHNSATYLHLLIEAMR